MKKAYTKPCIEMETFSPNEYIAACYAIVSKENSSDFTVIPGVREGKYTDGMNAKNKSTGWQWQKDGFEDDHLDKLAKNWCESDDGWFYDGDKLTSPKQVVSTWEAAGDADMGVTKITHQAVPVLDPIPITADNASSYNCGVNAS